MVAKVLLVVLLHCFLIVFVATQPDTMVFCGSFSMLLCGGY